MSAGYGRLIWRNGVFVPWEEATVHVSSVGHASVSAAFEGVHAYWSSTRETLYGFRLREHMQRLLDSLRMSWMEPEFDADDLVDATVRLLAFWRSTGKDLHIRPWGFAAGTHRQQMVPRGTPAEIAIETWEFESKLGQGRTCTLAVSSWPRFNHGASPASMKVFSNYHNGRLGNIDAAARGADWPVFLNISGHVTESSGACIALVERGRLVTPSLSDGVLDSITRRTLIQLAQEELGLKVETRSVERSELYLADEIFFMGTSAEVLPAVEVDGFPVGDGKSAGEVTQAIEDLYHDTVRAVTGKHDEWLTPVHPERAPGIPQSDSPAARITASRTPAAPNGSAPSDTRAPQRGEPPVPRTSPSVPGHVVADIADATRRFTGLLDADQRDDVLRAVSDDELRHSWGYEPRIRPGLALGDLRRDQRKAVHGMLQSVLSPHAYAQAAAVMALEDVLDHREGGHRDRHSGDYWTILFGTPDGDEPWGWRIEGHHVSVNVVVADGRVSATPVFLGANPARVTYRGRVVGRTLPLEEELVRELLDRMDPAARGLAVVSDLTPQDIRSSNSPRVTPSEPVGVTPARLDRPARELLADTVRLYLDRLRHEIADSEFAQIDLERVHFSWEGSLRRGEGHYYRLQSPDVLIEYDNTFHEANHIHSVWRRPSGDFGDDLLTAGCDASRRAAALGTVRKT